jgi:hypothetical protein
MPFEEWNALREEMAVEAICIGAADQMIPPDEMRKRIAHWREAGDQRWLNQGWEMGNALIALDKLGYDVVKRP